MKRLYELGGDIINDFMPTGAVGSVVKKPNSMLENNSQSSSNDDKSKKKKKK
tara:strand:- start:1429 stop:1584 length:156 start_codon:yes stop_codon:yes gene_type:complete